MYPCSRPRGPARARGLLRQIQAYLPSGLTRRFRQSLTSAYEPPLTRFLWAAQGTNWIVAEVNKAPPVRSATGSSVPSEIASVGQVFIGQQVAYRPTVTKQFDTGRAESRSRSKTIAGEPLYWPLQLDASADRQNTSLRRRPRWRGSSSVRTNSSSEKDRVPLASHGG